MRTTKFIMKFATATVRGSIKNNNKITRIVTDGEAATIVAPLTFHCPDAKIKPKAKGKN